jgi:glycosyltransferase involved in cell wall biosynthesis
MSTPRPQSSPAPPPTSPPAPIALADAFVHIHGAHTSLAQLNRLGSLSRERMVDRAVCPLIKHLAIVTYGGRDDAELADSVPPPAWTGSVASISNAESRETALFQASVPERVAASLAAANCRSALVYIDQHDGGEVAVQTATLLRSRGLRVGLVARCGYHWSWTVARDTAPNDPKALAAAMQEGDVCRAADVVVATTRRIADNLCWQHRLDPAHVRIVPNFVQPEGAVPPFTTREPGTILFAGRLAPEKRVDLLIRAVAMAARTNPSIRLIVIGDGPDRAELQLLARSFHTPVEFRERVSHAQLLREMGRCNVYAQPSRFEGHPKTILEAMAMGAPTLVTRAPGVDDEINPNVTGIICGDAEADLSAAIVWLVANPDIARRLGDRAARDIRARLGFETTFGGMLNAFREAMQLAGAGASDRVAPPPVRWEQTLLNAGPDAAAAQFAASVAAYAKRLDPDRCAIFLDSVNARLGSLAESQAALTPAPDAPAPRR